MKLKIDSYKPKKVDVADLPAAYVETSPRCLGIFLILFSLFWGGIPVAALLYAVITGRLEAGMLFLLIFAVTGLALFAAGLWIVSHRKKIKIDENNVSVDSRSIFGHNIWQEPLDRYKGIMARSEYHRGTKNRASHTLYIVELFHDDKKKKIRLYESRSDENFRDIWKDYARKLNLPALEKEGEKMIVREVEDLNKSVRELAVEDKIDISFNPDQPPPQGFDIDVRGEKLCIGLPKNRASLIGILIGLVFPAVFIYIGFGRQDAPLVFGIIGLLILLVMVSSAVWLFIARTMVAVSPDRVHIYHQTPWGDTDGKELSAESIEAVKVGKAKEGQGRDGVVLVTNKTAEIVAEGMSQEKLDWLKNCILTVITP